MAEIGQNVMKASTLLSNGELIAIPTETVYGLAANALDEKAVSQIFAVKERPTNNPLIVHIADQKEIEQYAKEIPPIAKKLMEKFWPGPLTLLLPKKYCIPNIVTASRPNVAIRVPAHPLTLQLLRSVSFPLAAPSANPFGYISPTTPEHVQRQIGGKIPYILDGGACQQGVESTIVGFENNTPLVYRLGAITLEELKEVAGTINLLKKPVKQLEAPGMLPYHYSPKTPFYLTENIEEFLKMYHPEETGVITFHEHIDAVPNSQLKILSPSADIREAAKNLYSALHALDALALKAIVAERLPEEGLGQTLNDRLERAANKK